MMHRFGEHGWRLGLGIGWLWLIGLIVIAMIIIIWIVMKKVNQKTESNNQIGNKSALDILNERYARGEIDKEEFEERRNNLL